MAITFVNAGSVAKAASGNVTPALPASWAAGDVFICLVAARDNVNCTLPAGWTAFDAGTNNGTGLRTGAWYRVAQGGDAAPLVTHTAGSYISSVVVAYRGCFPGGEIDVTGTVSVNGASTTLTFGSVTTVHANTQVIELAGVQVGPASAPTDVSGYSGSPAPTERVDGPYQALYAEVVIADFPKVSPGSTGSMTATNAYSVISNGLLVGLRAPNIGNRGYIIG